MSLEFVGAYTPMHHQYFQMVDMLIHHWKRTMDGLNPYAMSYVPSTTRIDTEDRVCTKKKNDNNVESSKWNKGYDNDATASTKWNICRTKEGRGYDNNNKNKKERNNKVFGNRFSRLQELAQDNQEVMDMLEKAVDETKHTTINKVEEEVNTNNSYNVDTVDMKTLEAEIQKHVESDRNDNNKNNNASDKKENIEKDKNNNNNEGIQVHTDIDDSLSQLYLDADVIKRNNDNLNRNESEYEYDSEKEREACYELHQDSESECTDSDCVSESDGDHYQSEGEVMIRQEYKDLEGHVLEIEEKLRKAQTTSYYNTLFNYLNIQQKECQCQRLNERNNELIELIVIHINDGL